MSITEFHKIFDLGYCLTIFRAQGSTIDEPLSVYDWNGMEKHNKYTATKAEYINIMPSEKPKDLYVQITFYRKKMIISVSIKAMYIN